MSEAKGFPPRYWLYFKKPNYRKAYHTSCNRSFMPPEESPADVGIQFLPCSEHEAALAEKDREIEHARREAADAMSGCCDCPMFKGASREADRLRAEIERQRGLKNLAHASANEWINIAMARQDDIDALRAVTSQAAPNYCPYCQCGSCQAQHEKR